MHTRGKVHRDLKPENVLFKSNGIAALTDFGIAGDRNKRMTERNIFGKPNQIFGTYAYMPPEQVNRMRGEATVLPTTDIFSFGVLAFQLLTGSLPFGELSSHNELALYQKRGKNGDWNRQKLTQLKRIESSGSNSLQDVLIQISKTFPVCARGIGTPASNKPSPYGKRILSTTNSQWFLYTYYAR